MHDPFSTYDQWKTASPEDDCRGPEVEPLEDALKTHCLGRNTECWPVCSFGWNYADLEPEGCTGIKRIVSAGEESITVEVGGHKVIGDGEGIWPDFGTDGWTEKMQDQWYEKARACYLEQAEALVTTSCSWGEWEGDGWCMSFKKDVTVPWEWINNEGPDYPRTAEEIVHAARKALSMWQLEMIDLDAACDKAWHYASEQTHGITKGE